MTMTEWETLPLGEVLTFQRGFDITQDEQSDGAYPVISSSGPKSTHAEFKVRGPGVVIGRKGSLGTVFYSDIDYWPHDTTLWVKDFHGNHPRFAYYFLQTMGFERLDAGASNPSLNRNHIHTIPVKWPPVRVQERIAGVLWGYDELIDNNRRRIGLLEEMVRAVFVEWFVRFRYPGHERHPRVASPLGDIPSGWEVRNLGDAAETFRGRSYRSADLTEMGGVPFLNLKCIARDGGFRRSGIKRYVGEYRRSHIATKGDIVVAVTDMTQERRIVAHAALVPSLGNDLGVCSMDLVRVEPKPPMPREFLYGFLRFSSFADEVKQHANGANVLHLAPERITDFQLALPPVALMERFAQFAAGAFEQIDTLENQVDNLRRARDVLLPRLVSGQIDLDTA